MRLAFPGLMDALAGGAVIVTPTPQLASVGVEQFNRARLSAGIQSWERPKIYSRDAWMTNCWQQARMVSANVPSLLSPLQERELWRQIIAHDRPDLFDVRAMAGIAVRGSRVLAEYQIPTEGDAWAEHVDAQMFLGWHRVFEQRLKAERWMTRSDLWRWIPIWMNHGVVDAGAVVFCGLTAVSPGLKQFGGRNIGITPSSQPAVGKAAAYDSMAREMEETARAVRYLLETKQSQSIGILVADLDKQGKDLIRSIHEGLYPSGERETGLVHVQAGALVEHPVISNALLLLELAQDRIPHASAGAILRSPFVDGANKERSARALADNRLRRARELDFSLSDIARATVGCPALQKTLGRVRVVTSKMQQFMRFPDWSATFSDILDAARWPAIEEISDGEQRAVDQWSTAFSELASLGLVAPPVSLHEAMAHLRAILSRSSELGDWSSPVQILDAKDSEGIEFEQSFVVNVSEDSWPPPNSLSPLIPYKLQRAHQVPGSNTESVGEERSRKTEALFTSAPEVYVSFTGQVAPAIRSKIVSSKAPTWTGPLAAESYSPVELDAQDDRQAPPLVQSGELRGGSGIIKAQSLCPFKAFAEYRLSARGEDDACFGFDALERGTFVHTALEEVWRRLETQANLKALSDEELRAVVQECVLEAVQDNGSGPIRTITSAAERERLTTVILDWLAVEKARTQPFTVEQVEQEREVELSGLKLKLRLDRMDRLANGSLVLIDYKSGAQSRNKLEGERPKEPQLLVYAATVDDPVEGIYFAELKNRNARAVGHASGKHFLRQQAVTDHKHRWDDFMEGSKQTVHKLAIEFQQGEASVSPLPGACEYCKIKPICRIKATGMAEEDEE